MSSIQEFNSLRNSMIQANVGYKPPHEMFDVVNDKALVGKSAVEGVGNMMTGHALMKTVLKMRKTAKASAKGQQALKDAGVTDDDIDDLTEALGNGDFTQAGQTVLSTATRAVNRALGNGVRRVADGFKDLGSKAQELISKKPAMKDVLGDDDENPFSFKNFSKKFDDEAGSADADLETDIFSGRFQPTEGLLDPFQADSSFLSSARSNLRTVAQDSDLDSPFSDPRSLNARLSRPSQKPQEDIEEPEEESEPPKALKDVSDETAEEGDLTKGAKIVKDIDETAETSAAGDEDPLNIAITAGLGLAGVIGGLFIKTHHEQNVAPHAIPPSNYGYQMF